MLRGLSTPHPAFRSRPAPRSRHAIPWKAVARPARSRLRAGVPALPLRIASAKVKKIDRATLAGMMGGLVACLACLRSGTGSLDHVREFGYATLAAEMIERQGVVRGLSIQIADADRAVMAMRLRADAASGKVGPLFGQEIAALDEFIRIHRFQLDQLSQGEYERALKSVAGRLGGQLQTVIAQAAA